MQTEERKGVSERERESGRAENKENQEEREHVREREKEGETEGDSEIRRKMRAEAADERAALPRRRMSRKVSTEEEVARVGGMKLGNAIGGGAGKEVGGRAV